MKNNESTLALMCWVRKKKTDRLLGFKDIFCVVDYRMFNYIISYYSTFLFLLFIIAEASQIIERYAGQNLTRLTIFSFVFIKSLLTNVVHVRSIELNER